MIKPFTLVITRSFVKDLKKLSRRDQLRIRDALEEIRKQPFTGKKITKAKIGKYRWRVGNWRLRYDIEKKNVIVLRVLKREDAYRRF